MARKKNHRDPDRFMVLLAEGGAMEGTRLSSRDVFDKPGPDGKVIDVVHTVRLDDGRVVETHRRQSEFGAVAAPAKKK